MDKHSGCDCILSTTIIIFDRLRSTAKELAVLLSLSKNFQYTTVSGIIKETGVFLWNNGEKMREAKQLLWI